MKQYLGDGVYADFDGWNIVLTAENGISATDRIVLEPQVLEELFRYEKRIQSEAGCTCSEDHECEAHRA
jgi:hypothetical protein